MIDVIISEEISGSKSDMVSGKRTVESLLRKRERRIFCLSMEHR